MTIVLPSQTQRLQQRVEISPDADRSVPASAWTWVDLSDRRVEGSRTLLLDQALAIQQGRADEASETAPGAVSFTVDNPDGALTPDNPLSPWYPSLDVGTPARVSVLGGSPHLTVDGSVGARARTPHHPDLNVGDLWVKAEVAVAFWPFPDGEVAELAGKVASGGQWSWLLWWIGPSIGLAWSADGTSVLQANSVVPLRMTAAGHLTIAAHLDVNNGAGGCTIRYWIARHWDDDLVLLDTITQPGTTSIFNSTAPLDIGDIGAFGSDRSVMSVRRLEVRSGDAAGTLAVEVDFTAQLVGTTSFPDSTGKTWTVEGNASIDNVQTRLVGQIDDITPTWPHGDIAAGDHPGESRSDITVSGVLRRLAQGEKPLESPLRRQVLAAQNVPDIFGYWPLEDGTDATSGASPLPGVGTFNLGGDYRFAGDDTHPGSKPLVNVSGAQGFGWDAVVPAPQTSITNWAYESFLRVPTKATEPSSTVVAVVDTTGTGRQWRIAMSSTNIRISATDVGGADVVNTLISSSGWTQDWTIMRLVLTQDGGNVDWRFEFAALGGVVFGIDGTFAGTIGRPSRLRNLDSAPPDGISFGHFVVSTDRTPGWLAPADRGWPDERAAWRFLRLCREFAVPWSIHGDPDESEPMGRQRPLTFLQLLRECEAAEVGILSEQTNGLGLHFRTRRSMLNQDPVAVLDAAENAITNPLAPKKDDQRLRNDVTAAREDGSSYRIVDPDADANRKPRYDEDVTVNVATDGQLLNQAGWRFTLGTWPEMRVSQISSELTVAPPQVIDEWLRLVLGDRFQVINLPRQHPSGMLDLLTEGWSESVSPTLWTPALNCSPAGAWTAGIIEDPIHGRADTAGSEISAGAGQNSTTPSTSHVAPGAFAPTATCLLICAWQSFDEVGDYTVPGSMVAGPETDGVNFSTMRSATQQLAIGGSTGPRTATFSVSDRWSAASAVVRGAAGNPVIEEALSLYSNGNTIGLTTTAILQPGWWLVAVHGWDLDADDTMPPPSGVGWILVGDSGRSPDAIPSASRTRIWAKQVTTTAQQSVLFRARGASTDNHARLLALSNVASVGIGEDDLILPVATTQGPLWIRTATHPTEFPFDVSVGGEEITVTGITGSTSPQFFEVERAINGIRKAHVAGTPVRLAHPMRTAL